MRLSKTERAASAENAWLNMLQVLYGPTGHLSAFKGYTGTHKEQAHKFKAYVGRICDAIREKRKSNPALVTPWDEEVALFDREIAGKEVARDATAARNLLLVENAAALQRAEGRMGLLPPPAQVSASMQVADTTIQALNNDGNLERAVGHIVEARTPARTSSTHLGNGKRRAPTDRRNDQNTAFAALSDFATSMASTMARATEQRALAATAVVQNVTATETPTKTIAKLTNHMNATTNPDLKRRYQQAIDDENEKVLAQFNV
jgi:hypothetical protein